MIEVIGKENINLKEKQMNEILDLIDKEEVIETEEKIEKALKKEQEQRQSVKNDKKEDFSESEAKFLLEDKAEELEKPSVRTHYIFKLLKIKKIFILGCRD